MSQHGVRLPTLPPEMSGPCSLYPHRRCKGHQSSLLCLPEMSGPASSKPNAAEDSKTQYLTRPSPMNLNHHFLPRHHQTENPDRIRHRMALCCALKLPTPALTKSVRREGMEGAPSLSGRRSSARSAAVCLRRMSKLKTFLSYRRNYVLPIPIPIPIPVLFVASCIPIPSAVPQPRSRAQPHHPSSPVQTSLHDRRKRSLLTAAAPTNAAAPPSHNALSCPIIPSSVPEREAWAVCACVLLVWLPRRKSFN